MLVAFLVISMFFLSWLFYQLGVEDAGCRHEREEVSEDEGFALIEDAMEDLKDLGWTVEKMGNRHGTFVYYKFIAPAGTVKV
jgi:hypothetical protein